MLDWIAFMDDVLGWVQWLTSLTFVALIGIALVYYFVNKKAMISCILLAVFLFIIAGVFASYGIQIVDPAFYAFLRGLF
jgi:hypothetical protein